MDSGDAGALAALRQSAMITRAFGIDNPAFAGGPARVAALLERFILYLGAIEGLKRQRAPARRGRAAGDRRRRGEMARAPRE